MAQRHITCPSCHAQIDIEDVLSHDIEQRLRASYDERLKQSIQAERELAARHERESFEVKILALQRENTEKSAALKQARNAEVELLDLQRKLKEKDEEVEGLIRRKVLESQSEIEGRARKAEAERYELREREWQQKLEATARQADELRRQVEQGSQQLSGEVQELAIEEFLRATFPSDEIAEVPKGVSGADCVQRVIVGGVAVGTIVYESKRTKQFQPSWIEKFRADIRSQGADVGVLVTEALPKGIDAFGLIGDVFVCGYKEFKALTLIVRDLVVRVGEISSAQENRGDKMSQLYSFLTSAEFRMGIEAIVEGFETMHSDLQRERAAMERIWKQREKQIEKVLLSTSRMYGNIKGIAGADVADVKQLELGSTRLADIERLDL